MPVSFTSKQTTIPELQTNLLYFKFPDLYTHTTKYTSQYTLVTSQYIP